MINNTRVRLARLWPGLIPTFESPTYKMTARVQRFLEHHDAFVLPKARLLLVSGRGERNKVCGVPIATQTL